MIFYTYVIESEEGFRYTGHTSDLERRLIEHNTQLCKSTKRGNNWRYIYTKEFPTRSEAMKHEKYLKSSAGRRYLNRYFEKELSRGGVRPDIIGTE